LAVNLGGRDIRTVQQLLGHKDVATIMIYTHVMEKGFAGTRSPLDLLGVLWILARDLFAEAASFPREQRVCVQCKQSNQRDHRLENSWAFGLWAERKRASNKCSTPL
jgi:hypothetical protein